MVEVDDKIILIVMQIINIVFSSCLGLLGSAFLLHYGSGAVLENDFIPTVNGK